MTNVPMMQMPVPSVEELELDQYMIGGVPFNELVARRQEFKKYIEECEKEIAEIDSEVGAALDLKGVKNVVWNKEYLVTRREASKPRQLLDRILLLAAGVTPLQLQSGTKLGKPGKSGVTVRRLSEVRMETEEVIGAGEMGEGSVQAVRYLTSDYR
jgi:hypothetical protein